VGLFLFFFFHAWIDRTEAFELPEQERLQSVARSDEWTGLLQYQRGWHGFEKSEVNGESFFLAPEGREDPRAELEATLRAFHTPVGADPESHPTCRFPSRLALLRKRFRDPGLWKDLPSPPCKNLENYRSRIQNRKLSVVFTSYHRGSAASVFGHSFLKFSGNNENELFDTGINFAANPTTANPALYALYGLIGVFPSTFSALPFYYKVREYNDSESRDLWLYELNLTSEQIDRVILHLWELGNTHFRYFYFNENCSYHVLRALEGALPELRFFDSRPVYLIPSESIKALYRIPGLVGRIRYRPSLLKTALAGFGRLNPDQQREVKQELAASPPRSNDPAVLDLLIDAIDLKKDPASTEKKDRLLEARAKLDGTGASRDVPPPVDERPDLGHGSRRIRLGSEWTRLGNSVRWNSILQVRAAHHDLMDPSEGYPRHLQIDFGRIGFRLQPEANRVLLDELTLVDLTALAPDHALGPEWSYSVGVGYKRGWTLACEGGLDCSRFALTTAIGKTAVFLEKQTLYALFQLEPAYGSSFTGSKWKLELGPVAGLIWEWIPGFKSRLEARTRYDFTVPAPWQHSFRLENRIVFGNRFGFEFQLQRDQSNAQTRESAGLNGLLYF
jgi:hypothetical protein